jgi:hypothetical protein
MQGLTNFGNNCLKHLAKAVAEWLGVPAAADLFALVNNFNVKDLANLVLS